MTKRYLRYTAKPRSRPLRTARYCLTLTGTLIAAHGAYALEFDTGNTDLKIRWDNTVKYSSGYRLKSSDVALTNDLNQDDGDRNFKKGLISNRLDLLSEADIVYRNFGARVSAAAWYDSVYNKANGNDSVGTFGPGSSTANSRGSPTEFLSNTRQLHGDSYQLLDAFVFGKFEVAGMPTSIRLGRFAQVWGESIFFGSNAIAGAMTPVDVIKLSSVPGSQFKETMLQVPQVSGQIQFGDGMSLGAYYQFAYRPNRYNGVGSYFSVSDTTVQGGQFTYLGPGVTVPSAAEQLPSKSGQAGVQFRFSAAETDYGIYLVRFHDKGYQVVPTLGASPFGVAPTSFRAVYHEGITALGASFSRTFGAANVAGEVSIRNNMDLASSHSADASALAPPGIIKPSDNTNNPAYAVGRTAHINFSTLWQVPRTALWNEASFVGELAWNRVLHCSKNCNVYSYATRTGTIDPNATRDAVNYRFVFAPSYRQVIPGLDFSVPIGIGWAPKGNRSLALGPGPSIADGGGDVSVGLNGTFRDVWRFSLNMTHFFGSANTLLAAPAGSPPGTPGSFTYGQTLKDRNFISLSLARSF